jgi:ABC-type sugar transport system substrate-binding protein
MLKGFRKIGTGLSVVALGAVMLGVVTAQDATTICFGYQDLETEFWVAGHLAITTTLADQGVNVLEYNANEDPNKQLEQINDCIAQGVDGIIIIPQDGDSAVTIVQAAQDADIPIAVLTVARVSSWWQITKSSPNKLLNLWLPKPKPAWKLPVKS